MGKRKLSAFDEACRRLEECWEAPAIGYSRGRVTIARAAAGPAVSPEESEVIRRWLSEAWPDLSEVLTASARDAAKDAMLILLRDRA